MCLYSLFYVAVPLFDERDRFIMIVTTTPAVEGKRIYQYLGVVSGIDRYLVGGLLGEGLFAIDEYFSASYKRAEEKMIQKAVALGADAIVGVQYSPFSWDGDRRVDMQVTLVGTAVKTVEEAFDELPEL